MPDAVVFPAFNISTQLNTEYQLRESNWDDYGYRTTFNCDSSSFSESINIAYIGQPSGRHTIGELKPLYILDEWEYRLLIAHPLPEKFYSYWSVDLLQRFGYHWYAMQHFNHIFYVAIRNGVWSAEEFQQLFLKKVYQDPAYYVFKHSLFRGQNLSAVKENFEEFVSCLLQFDVIDVKYLSLDYFQNSSNIESLKERSIRKQFVYEYLLQQQVKTLVPNASPTINSHFWIPAIKADSPVLSGAPTYLSGYLKLVKVNLSDVLEKYTNLPFLKQIFDRLASSNSDFYVY